ncbi:unnamed protein product, partial [Pylaiella littoralis]
GTGGNFVGEFVVFFVTLPVTAHRRKETIGLEIKRFVTRLMIIFLFLKTYMRSDLKVGTISLSVCMVGGRGGGRTCRGAFILCVKASLSFVGFLLLVVMVVMVV